MCGSGGAGAGPTELAPAIDAVYTLATIMGLETQRAVRSSREMIGNRILFLRSSIAMVRL
jgi:hypothetical protein